ncbi:MAG TPA: cytochrome c [Dinghuibacter sp.]|jgi:mono/diheme cytochrome c family protein|uniref:c-type cytochrome n=1 Tax=Dinghuibacter sp. TaxID=2024697 RepID=UPI002D103BAC|nr:cytochrome c [Dinghuibacter sp.]HTJ13752.1 cytochrome c [Dinghuibacter sp.]
MKVYSTLIALCILFFLMSAAPHNGAVPQQTAQNPLAAQMARGKKLYQQQCLTCHQVDGTGVMNMNPPLVKTTYVQGDKTALIKIVVNGMTTPLTIDDYEYHNVMPPHTTMTDQEIADVLTYVRRSFGNKATAVTAAEVKKAR